MPETLCVHCKEKFPLNESQVLAGHIFYEVAEAVNQLTVRLVRHSQRKWGATDRPNLRSMAPVFEPNHPMTFEYTPGQGIIANDGDEIMVGNRHFLTRTWSSRQSRQQCRHQFRNLCGSRRPIIGNPANANELRPEAQAAIHSFKSMLLRTVLLTGDAKSVAQEVGRKLGVDEIVSDLLPEDKLRYVRQLIEKGQKVAMVGDGINDAPALMQATVGVAMGPGTDVARESANVVLIGSRSI